MPLPDNQQPPAAQGQGESPQGGVIEPLPDNQQPPSAREPAQPQSQQQPQVHRPPESQQQQPQQPVVHRPPQSQDNNAPAPGSPNGGVLMPLPDDQQPPAAKQPQQ